MLQDVLKKEFNHRRLTINRAAKDCSIPVSVLHAWLNGVLPSGKNLIHIAKLSDYLGLPLESLLFGREAEQMKASAALLSHTFVDGKNSYHIKISKKSI